MNESLPSVRQELIGILGRIVGDGPLPDDLRQQALNIFATILAMPVAPTAGGSASDSTFAGATATGATPAAAAVGARRLVYVHGICRHFAGFSNGWWSAMKPFVPGTFGAGMLGQTRLEVVWSDLVNQGGALLAEHAATIGGAESAAAVNAIAEAKEVAAEIKDALRDRADHIRMGAEAPLDNNLRAEAVFEPPQLAEGGFSIPGLNCIDDFTVYLTVDSVRQSILDRFIAVVRPELQAGRTIDIIAHSWGTVVAYEGLRQLADEGLTSPLVHRLFTVGAALSIPPVKSRLRSANRDGRKPANTRRWINLDARGDIVGGPLKGRPYEVDVDFINLEPTNCGGFLGLVNPQCAHSSYFDSANTEVNRDILAKELLAS